MAVTVAENGYGYSGPQRPSALCDFQHNQKKAKQDLRIQGDGVDVDKRMLEGRKAFPGANVCGILCRTVRSRVVGHI